MSNGDAAQYNASGLFLWCRGFESNGSLHWLLPIDLGGMFVFSQALKRWVPNAAISSPLGERYFAKQYRFDPVDRAPFACRESERFATAQNRRLHSDFR